MKELIQGITTRDVLAVLVVASALLFNGISLITGKGPDAATMTLASVVFSIAAIIWLRLPETLNREKVAAPSPEGAPTL